MFTLLLLSACAAPKASDAIALATPADLIDPAVVSRFEPLSDPLVHAMIFSAVPDDAYRVVSGKRIKDAPGKVTFDNYRRELTKACDSGDPDMRTWSQTRNGTIAVTKENEETTRLDIDLFVSSVSHPDPCDKPLEQTYAIRLTSTTVRVGERSDITTEGDVALDGRRVHLEAHQVTDNTACEGEPLEGETWLTGGDNTAVITYDGATSCTSPGQATWSLNGEPRGPIEVHACSGGEPSLLAALALPFLLSLRRGGPSRARAWSSRATRLRDRE